MKKTITMKKLSLLLLTSLAMVSLIVLIGVEFKRITGPTVKNSGTLTISKLSAQGILVVYKNTLDNNKGRRRAVVLVVPIK